MEKTYAFFFGFFMSFKINGKSLNVLYKSLYASMWRETLYKVGPEGEDLY